MVEAEPDLQQNHKSDVKDDRQNGRSSKDLELVRIGSKGTTLDPESETNAKTDFEKAIELSEYGVFHYFLLAVCGLVSMSEEMDVVSMSFILPSACDLRLTTYKKGWLNSIIFVGMIVGAYGWGSIADTVGRRKVLIVVSFLNALCIVASTFVPYFGVFIVFRFLNGATLGGSGPVIWSYFAEFQPKSKRGSMLSSMAAFWTVGNLFVAGLAWLIIYNNIGDVTIGPIQYKPWRLFLLLCATPSFMVAILLLLLPESPKFLLSQGRDDEALEIVRSIYAMNTGNPRESFVVKELIYDDSDKVESSDLDEKKNKYLAMLEDVIDNSKQLFVQPILRFTIISISINFTFHVGYYGLMMWFPELYSRFQRYETAHPGEDAGFCQVVTFNISKNHLDDECKSISNEMFMESLITVASAIPGNIFAVLSIDYLGRKFFLVFSTFASGLTELGMLLFANGRTSAVILGCVFSAIISCGNAGLDCLITEVFPTNLRATGIAISMMSARLGGVIGNYVISYFLDTFCEVPMVITSVLLMGGGLFCLFLPNTTRKPLS